MKYKRKTGNVIAFQFPDSGPEQHDISKWVNETVKTHLYDGNIVNNIKTGTNAVWHWRYMSIDGIRDWCKIGDWIVKDIDGKIRVFDNETFNKLFES